MATIRERLQYEPDGRMRWPLAPLLFLVPLVVAIAGAYTLNVLFMHGWYYVAYHFYETIGIAGAVVIAAIGTVMFLASIYVATWCPIAFELAYTKSRMARCIESRAGAIVKPDDPQAVFVGLTERARWKKVLGS
jgi:hypothetical protein